MKHIVVRVFSECTTQSSAEPWQKHSKIEKSGTASLISHEGKRYIITNEHVIQSATCIHLKIDKSANLYPARVIFKNSICDLALLALTNEEQKKSFLEQVEFLELECALPENGTKVVTHGFPTGGNSYCQTEGTISRIESSVAYERYSFPSFRIQSSA